eukprot:Skav226046  [mRNA]  locus=scaffold211:62217:63788:+ [translate_table: standard]
MAAPRSTKSVLRPLPEEDFWTPAMLAAPLKGMDAQALAGSMPGQIDTCEDRLSSHTGVRSCQRLAAKVYDLAVHGGVWRCAVHQAMPDDVSTPPMGTDAGEADGKRWRAHFDFNMKLPFF